jgi:hypothetical protein
VLGSTVNASQKPPRAWLRRNRRQFWYSVRDIPPARFTRVIDFAAVAGASVDLIA